MLPAMVFLKRLKGTYYMMCDMPLFVAYHFRIAGNRKDDDQEVMGEAFGDIVCMHHLLDPS